jgi:hypothetical protein
MLAAICWRIHEAQVNKSGQHALRIRRIVDLGRHVLGRHPGKDPVLVHLGGVAPKVFQGNHSFRAQFLL